MGRRIHIDELPRLAPFDVRPGDRLVLVRGHEFVGVLTPPVAPMPLLRNVRVVDCGGGYAAVIHDSMYDSGMDGG